jgi:hypothetical protein
MTFNAVAVASSFAEEIHRRAPEIESVRRLHRLSDREGAPRCGARSA